MNKMRVEIPIEIDTIINQLAIKDKIELTRRLEKTTMGKRIDALLKRIDTRTKKICVSEKEINKIVKEVRKELYNESSR